MAIIDQYGRPIERAVLREPQTASLANLHRQFANHPARGLTPQRLARIMEDAERGNVTDQVDLAEDMEERDAHIFAELSKRRRAVIKVDWDIEPPRNASAAEQAAAEFAKEAIGDLPEFEDVLLDMGDAILKGFACLELTWARRENVWLPEAVELRPQRWFTVDRETRTEIRLREGAVDGLPLTPFGWIVHRHQARPGYVTRSALARVLAWPYMFRNYAARDLAEFLEIFGLPVRVGTYPSGADDTEKARLLAAVIGIGHAAAGIMPEGMKIDFQEAAKGSASEFMAMIDWCERSSSKAILGATLTSQADRGSNTNALGNVHRDVALDLRDSDAKQFAGTLTRDLVYPLIALNRPGIDGLRRCPRFVFRLEEADDLHAYSQSIPALVDVGMRIPASFLHERLQIPEPEGDEPVLARARPTPADPAPGLQPPPPGLAPIGQALKRLIALRGETPATLAPDRIDDLLEDALADWAPVVEPLLERLERATQAALTGGASAEELARGLALATAASGEDPLVERLARATFIARLLGEADVDLDRGAGPGAAGA